MTPIQFDILRAAITIAKNKQVTKAQLLKDFLKEDFPEPEREPDIQAALSYWANYEQETNPAHPNPIRHPK